MAFELSGSMPVSGEVEPTLHHLRYGLLHPRSGDARQGPRETRSDGFVHPDKRISSRKRTLRRATCARQFVDKKDELKRGRSAASRGPYARGERLKSIDLSRAREILGGRDEPRLTTRRDGGSRPPHLFHDPVGHGRGCGVSGPSRSWSCKA